jgi:hypothetical protein
MRCELGYVGWGQGVLYAGGSMYRFRCYTETSVTCVCKSASYARYLSSLFYVPCRIICCMLSSALASLFLLPPRRWYQFAQPPCLTGKEKYFYKASPEQCVSTVRTNSGGYLAMSSCQCSETPRHEGMYGYGGMLHAFLTSALDGGDWSGSRPGHFTVEIILYKSNYYWHV